MSSLDELKMKAKQLLSEGHSPGQIADELSLSVETITWLLTQEKGSETPKDVHIDWTSISANGELLEDLALILSKRHYLTFTKDPSMPDASYDVMVGISISGIPVAAVLAAKEGVDLAIYHPSKQNTGDRPMGSISSNFSQVKGARSIIVDDVITSGKTMVEVIEYLRKHGSIPVAIWVIFDKRGLPEVDGVPVISLFKVSRID